MRQNWSQALGFGRLKQLIKAKIHSSLGQNLLENLVPLGEKEKILAKQELICQCLDYILKIQRVRFDGLTDLGKILQKPDILDFEQLKKVQKNCVLSGDFCANWVNLDELEKEDLQLLGKKIEDLQPLQELRRRFDKIFDDNGKVRESASAKLGQICSRLRSLDLQINSLLEKRYLSSQQDFVAYQDGRVMLLTSAGRTLSGVVHGRSASRSSMYIEPQEVVAQNNQLCDLRDQKLREINKILKDFSVEVFSHSEALLRNQKILAKLDYYFGLAEFSKELGAGKVAVLQESKLDFRGAYHPLLKLDAERECVPFSAKLGDDYSYLVVSGANAGGKSVFLKGVGLLTLMANCGLLIPADPQSQVGIFDKYFVGIGDMQSLDSQLSSFSGYLANLKKALDFSGEKSLVIFDELGSYTDPDQGFALGAAALETLCANGSVGVISTHLNKLKLFAHHNNNCQNASMSFDAKMHNPTYHLQVGFPADSHALELAANLRFSAFILERAKQMLDADSLLFSQLLSDLGKEKNDWQKKNSELKNELAEAEICRKRFLQKLEALEKNEKKIKKEQLAKAKKYFENLQAQFSLELKKAKKDRNSQALFYKSAKIVKELGEQEFEQVQPLKNVEVGQTVFVKSFDENGKVVAADGAKAKVEVGGLLVSCELKNLYPAKGRRKQQPVLRQKVLQSVAAAKELKLMGKNFLEAKAEIDRFVDDALLAGLDLVRIVHGKGVLAGKVRDYLRQKKLKYSVPPEKFGGDGVSEVRL